jgi:isopenicillin N synthase-like dioxygenase
MYCGHLSNAIGRISIPFFFDPSFDARVFPELGGNVLGQSRVLGQQPCVLWCARSLRSAASHKARVSVARSST